LVVAFNVVGTADLILDYYHAVKLGLPALAGELGATYAIPIIYVPVLRSRTSLLSIFWRVHPVGMQRSRTMPQMHLKLIERLPGGHLDYIIPVRPRTGASFHCLRAPACGNATHSAPRIPRTSR
jgi:hypothetical protein